MWPIADKANVAKNEADKADKADDPDEPFIKTCPLTNYIMDWLTPIFYL